MMIGVAFTAATAAEAVRAPMSAERSPIRNFVQSKLIFCDMVSFDD